MSHCALCILESIGIIADTYNSDEISNITFELLELHLQIHQSEIDRCLQELFIS